MNKIKVVHIITKLELGGAQQNTLYTVEHLDKTKFEVYLLTGCGGILDESAKLLAKKSFVKVYFIKNLVREINIIRDILAFIEILELLAKIKPQIIHTHSSKAGVIGRWAAFFLNFFTKKKIKILHTFHGFAFSRFHNFFIRNFYIFLEFFTAIISDKLIFVSLDNIKTAKKYKIGSNKKYVLIRSGIKITDFYKASFDKELREKKRSELQISLLEKVITTIGPFKPQKNLSDFIKMAKIVVEKLPQQKIKFLIAGDGEQRNKLLWMTKKLQLEDKIKFLSWYKDIKGLLAATDVFVMTSLWEGLPRSAVEALVAGIPVVAYAVDGLNDIVRSGENGFLVQPKDYNTLAEHIVYLLKHEDILEKFKKNAVGTIEKSFDIDYMVIQQEELYIGVIQNEKI
jgi:glycosyltransferase involved in cell wall biosynthesis